MKDSRYKVIIQLLCATTNTKIVKKGKKLYYYFFHEDFYPIFLQNQSNVLLTKNIIKTQNQLGTFLKKEKSFLEIKRVIVLFRSNNYFSNKRYFFDNLLKQKKKILFQFILESISFLLLFTHKQKNVIERKYISISVHKPLEYIENHWQSFSLGFSGHISCYFHPEIILRILRKRIQDSCFLHLIRIFLYLNIYSLDTTLQSEPFKKFINVLWNIYILEIDNFILLEYQNSYISTKYKNVNITEWLSCLQKIKGWKSFFQKEQYKTLISKNFKKNFFCISKKKVSFLEDYYTFKYLRTNNLWFIVFQKKKTYNFFIKERIIRFFSRRLGYFFQVNTITLLLTQNSYFFLAYILQFTKKRTFIKINTCLFLLKNYIVFNYVSFLSPLFLIITALTKQNFCTSFGYPKSKSGWSTWTDKKIIEYFNRIRDIFFLFYSGCNNNKALYRIQYILYYSCAKTLACKHKTNLQKIFKKFTISKSQQKNHLYFTKSLYSSNQITNYKLIRLKKDYKKIRLWNFQLKQIESILFFVEQLYK